VPSGRQFSNPAAHFFPNGSLIIAYRADARTGPPAARATGRVREYVSLAVAPQGTATRVFLDDRASPAIDQHAGEDPFLWQDDRGHFHVLMHNMGDADQVASHAFSRDSFTWTLSRTAPYNTTVHYDDGTKVELVRRERPQLVLSPTGQPQYFSTGGVYHVGHDPYEASTMASYTIVQRVVSET
jgi:hypothetical protein